MEIDEIVDLIYSKLQADADLQARLTAANNWTEIEAAIAPTWNPSDMPEVERRAVAQTVMRRAFDAGLISRERLVAAGVDPNPA